MPEYDGEPGRSRPRAAPAFGRGLRIAFVLLALFGLTASSLGLRDPSQAVRLAESSGDRLNARQGLLALRLAYPDRITDLKLDFETGEWVIEADGRLFCWAEGRVLPLEERDAFDAYRPFINYLYPWKIIEPEKLDEATVERLKALPEKLRTAPLTHPAFITALYGGRTEKTLWAKQRRTKFLGKRLNVHEMIVAPLARVEAGILAASGRSEKVRAFIKDVNSIGAYNFRYIRGQRELSRHSYGVAVDILPKGRAADRTYWLWVAEQTEDWPTYPLSKRWMPPEEVVRIFEEHGFIWGGKWLDYDTMHFEYRPEMLFLREWCMPRHIFGLR